MPTPEPTPGLRPAAAGTRERPSRLRRSCLTVPASSERMLAKAPSLSADEVILDLEDSVALEAKAAARTNAVAALQHGAWGEKTVAVRVNDCNSALTFRDLISVVEGAGQSLDCIILPKATSAAQVAFVDQLLTQLEAEQRLPAGAIGLELLIESASGLTRLSSLLEASARVEALIFGPGDMAADLQMPTLTIGERHPDSPDRWQPALFTILAHARAAGVQAIDGPYARIHDSDGFLDVARQSRALGFDGKWVLHPDQIDLANQIYSQSQVEFERAIDIVEHLSRSATNQGPGAVMFGSEMIDEASRKLANVVAEQGQRQGLSYRPVPEGVPPAERAAWRQLHT